jgi:hypothetical protein
MDRDMIRNIILVLIVVGSCLVYGNADAHEIEGKPPKIVTCESFYHAVEEHYGTLLSSFVSLNTQSGYDLGMQARNEGAPHFQKDEQVEALVQCVSSRENLFRLISYILGGCDDEAPNADFDAVGAHENGELFAACHTQIILDYEQGDAEGK